MIVNIINTKIKFYQMRYKVHTQNWKIFKEVKILINKITLLAEWNWSGEEGKDEFRT